MIPADLLDQLREKDPEIHSRYVNLMQDIDPLCEGDIPFCQNAIMQACLQEAIRARGWLLEQSTFTARPSAKIWKKTDPVWTTYSAAGSTEAEALLRAYLAAIPEAA